MRIDPLSGRRVSWGQHLFACHAEPGQGGGGGAADRKKLYLADLPAEFARRQNNPPEAAEFRHPLLFRIAASLFTNGKQSLAALSRLLAAEVWHVNDQPATHREVFITFTDPLARPELAAAIQRDGLPCDREFHNKFVRGNIRLTALSEGELEGYQELLRGFPKPLDQLYYLYCLNEGNSRQAVEEKLSWYELAIMLCPDLPQAYVHIHTIEDLADSRKEEYIAAWLDLNPDFMPAAVVRTSYYVGRQDYQGALSCLDAALNHHPGNTQLLLLKADQLFHLKRNAEALSICQTVIAGGADGPLDYQAYYIASAIRAESADPDELGEALTLAKRATELCPDEPSHWVNRADILDKLERPSEACDCLQRAIEIDPAYHFAYFELARLAAESGDYETAFVFLDKIIELNPANADAYQAKAWMYLQMEAEDEAVAVMRPVWGDLDRLTILSMLRSEGTDR